MPATATVFAFAFVFVPFSICTFDTYTETQTQNFFSGSFPPETTVCVSVVFVFVSTSFGFIRCYVDIHLALLYCSVTVNVKMPFRKFDILYLDILSY